GFAQRRDQRSGRSSCAPQRPVGLLHAAARGAALHPPKGRHSVPHVQPEQIQILAKHSSATVPAGGAFGWESREMTFRNAILRGLALASLSATAMAMPLPVMADDVVIDDQSGEEGAAGRDGGT